MKSVLITGATGFVGSHILQAFRERPAADARLILACRDPDRLPPGHGAEVRIGDLRDADYRRALVQGVDVICHAAAWSSLWNHAPQSDALFLQPTLALLRQARAQGVGRFVFVSSTSVSGPEGGGDPQAPSRKPDFWPHLANVGRIEDALRAAAGPNLTGVSLRCGLFAGEHYGLGLLPILLPRLKTHLVPWIAGGRTGMPIIDGRDVGAAFRLAALAEGLSGYESFNIVGPQVPTAREVIDWLHAEFGYPRPHFSVPFAIGYRFARLMELLDPLLPWEPLVVRSIVYLLEETHASNTMAAARLGYAPQVDWRMAIRKQLAEMARRQQAPMSMAVPTSG